MHLSKGGRSPFDELSAGFARNPTEMKNKKPETGNEKCAERATGFPFPVFGFLFHIPPWLFIENSVHSAQTFGHSSSG
jgi:hypothetical protein